MRAINLADYIVRKCFNEKQPVTNIQLNRLLYYIQRDFLKRTYACAFFDSIEAWSWGAVVPVVYYRYAGFGAREISPLNKEESCIDDSVTKEDKEIIDAIIERKRYYESWRIAEELQSESSAWYSVYNNGMGNKREIPIEMIQAEVD